MFIVFEGIDRSGKSTQCRLLANRLKIEKIIKYPIRDGSCAVSGPVIDSYLKGQLDMRPEAASLLLLSNLFEIVSSLKDETIIMDRYIWSHIAYSTERGGSLGEVEYSSLVKELRLPDCVIFMDAQPEDVMTRSDYGDERYDNLKFQTSISNRMKRIFKSLPCRLIVIDKNECCLGADEIHEIIYKRLLPF